MYTPHCPKQKYAYGSVSYVMLHEDNGAQKRIGSACRHDDAYALTPQNKATRLILVPATGVKWSTVWSTVLPQTSATPPPRDAVYEPDPEIGGWSSSTSSMRL